MGKNINRVVNMAYDTTIAILIGVTLLGIYLLARKGRVARQQEEQRDNMRELNTIQTNLNRSLGYPEGQGPTNVMVNGQVRSVNTGHTERMKEPAYQRANETVKLLSDITQLEAARTEANASGNLSLGRQISEEISSLTSRVLSLAEKDRREPGRS